MSLLIRLSLRVVLVTPIIAALMFIPAGSLRFWPGWIFVGIFTLLNALLCAYFYRHDPKLLERRLENKEPRREQKKFKMFWVPLWVCLLVLPGLDYRFGWSASSVGSVPLWLSAVSWLLICAGWLVFFQVLRFNSFAAATVRVEAGQKVITDGPYQLVRHPMYSGFVLIIFATSLALGSYFAIVPAVLLIPPLVVRLLDEERVLRQELPGYAEYCKQTRFRLVPLVF